MSPEVCLALQEHRCCKNFTSAKHRHSKEQKKKNQHFWVTFAACAKKALEVVKVTGGASGEFQLLPQ